MGILEPMVGEKKDPEVKVLECCKEQTGLLVLVNEVAWLFRDSKPRRGNQLATSAFKVLVCRGCYQPCESSPFRGWTWGVDEQLDEHLRQVAREMEG